LVKLGVDVNYPPYAYLNENGKLDGFGVDFAKGFNKICEDIEIEVVQTLWEDCWTSDDTIGAKIDSGELDGCMTYTNTEGVRHEYMEFSWSYLERNKAAGFISLLDEAGMPLVRGDDSMEGRKVIDVGGWAPTSDGIGYVMNHCTDERFSEDFELLVANGNDEALKMLYDKEGDVIFIYAEQAYNFQQACEENPETEDIACDLWSGFGQDFAYVQTGQFGYMKNGTTLVMAKKGSGIGELVNPCMQTYMESRKYRKLCENYNKTNECFPNEYFKNLNSSEPNVYDLPTDEHTSGCEDGYCPCTYEDGPAGVLEEICLRVEESSTARPFLKDLCRTLVATDFENAEKPSDLECVKDLIREYGPGFASLLRDIVADQNLGN